MEALLQKVLARYAKLIFAEVNSGAPDAERLKELKDGRQACLAYQQTLRDAGPERVAALATQYAALLGE